MTGAVAARTGVRGGSAASAARRTAGAARRAARHAIRRAANTQIILRVDWTSGRRGSVYARPRRQRHYDGERTAGGVSAR